MSRDPIEFQRRRFETYGDTYTSHVGAISMLVTREPELIQRVLVDDAVSYQKPERGIGAAQLRRLLGNGLLSSNGEFWKEQRRQIQPAFAAQHVQSYAASMVRHAQAWVQRQVDGAELNISSEMMSLTLQIVAEVLMGLRIESQQDPTVKLMREFRAAASSLSGLLPRWLPYPPRWQQDRVGRRIRAMLDQLVERHRRGGAPEMGECLLGVLSRNLDEPGAMSRAQLLDEALTLFSAGHETTSHALTWTHYLLCQHPEVRARMQAEIDSVLGARAATYADAPQLAYTGRVLSESMRLYPPAFALLREARRETELGPWHVASGAHVLLSVYHVHHHPQHHRDPERFDPDRFQPEAQSALAAGAYLPFGAGTRSCIGKRFAQLEATLLLATLYRSLQFELTQPGPPARAADVTLSPRGGLHVRVRRR